MKLFVYGTLKAINPDGEDFYVRGNLYDLGPYPAARAVGREDAGWIKGKIIDPMPNELKAMDRMEGHPHYYRREETMAYTEDKEEHETVWVYHFCQRVPEQFRCGEEWR